MTSPLINPFDPHFNADPFSQYERLRARDPVHRSPLGIWFVGRYDDVRAILKDPRLRVPDMAGLLHRKNQVLKTRAGGGRCEFGLEHLTECAQHWLPFIEGPRHERLRRAYQSGLSRSRVERLRPRVRAAARSLLESQQSRGEMDAVRDFARPLSFKVIADLLGIAPNMFSFVRTWSEQLTRIVLTLNSLDELMLLDVASREFSDYLKYLIAYRKRDPGDDLISTFCIDRRAKHEQLTDAELISMCIVMSMANVQTTTAFLGVGLFELLKHPDQLRRLRENPDLLASAVDELLRFDGSQHFVSRTALEDIEIGGKLISAGEEVYLGLGCANRDQMRFEEADQLVFERQRNRHLAFGDGAHWCVGAHLARVEAEEAFRALLEVLPDVHLVSSRVEWHPHVLSRGPARLPVRFSARPEIP